MIRKKMTAVALSIFITGGAYADTQMRATTQQKQQSLTPVQTLQILKEGHQRFMSGKTHNSDVLKEMKHTAKKGQFPKAVILNCIDSRTIPEVLFDQTVGNVFVSAIAGNVAGTDVVGGMEFATSAAGASLIVVMGHTQCGAVQGACGGGSIPGALGMLLSSIKPAVMTVAKQSDKPLKCQDYEVVDTIARQNVLDQMQRVMKSPVIAKQIKSGQLKVVGAMHNLSDGRVTFFDENNQPL